MVSTMKEHLKKNITQALKHNNDKENIYTLLQLLSQLPAIITDNAPSIIRLQDLFRYLIDFFTIESINRNLDIQFYSKDTEFLPIPNSPTIFYQLMISIIDNLIYLIPKGSKILFTATTTSSNPLLITIEHNSYTLSEQQIIKYTENKSFESGNIFLLNMKQVFDSLRAHNLDYSITKASNTQTGNIITIFSQIKNTTDQEDDKILNLNKYLKNTSLI